MTLSHAGRRRKGANFERQVAAALRDLGFPEACRNIERRVDQGDLLPLPPFAVECKDQQSLSLGAWLDQARAGARNVGQPHAAVVVKRKRVSDIRESMVVMDLTTFARVLAALRDTPQEAAS